MPCAVTALHQLETLFEFSIEYLVTNLQVKEVLLYKPRIVFIVIHEIWKKNVAVFSNFRNRNKKQQANWDTFRNVQKSVAIWNNFIVISKSCHAQILPIFILLFTTRKVSKVNLWWIIWLLKIISIKKTWAQSLQCLALLFN